jgi:alanine racemase
MLYGVSPFLTPLEKMSPAVRDLLHKLQPVMTFKSRLIAVRKVAKGESIGYGGHWTCGQDSLIGVVAVGYGDGYPGSAKSGTPVLLNGERCPIVGKVSMGMLCIELDLHRGGQTGDEVILWGPGLPLEEVATSLGVIPYELMTGVTGRVEFQYE